MRAVVMRARGGPEVLEVADLPVPEPGPKEVRVRLKAAALNHLDVWVRKGVASPKLPLPHVLGADGSGVVDAVGPGVEGFAPGDEVVINPGLSCGRCERCLAGEDNLCPRYQILGEHRHGTYAEYVVLPEANLAPKPKSLFNAASSGIGLAAIQIAKLFGARVIATAGSEDKLRRAKALGADETVNYTHPDWPKEVRRLTGGKGADKVVDHTGALYFEGVIKATANGGRIAIAGASSGYEGTLPFAHVFYRQLSILGSTMASKSRLFPILRFVEEGKLKPVVGQVLPLEAAAEGHRLLEERRVFGKVVLQMG